MKNLKFVLLLALVLPFAFFASAEDETFSFFSDQAAGSLYLKKKGGVIKTEIGSDPYTLKVKGDGSVSLMSGSVKVATFSPDLNTLTVHQTIKNPAYVYDRSLAPGVYRSKYPSDLCSKKKLHRWAGRKLPSKFDKVTKKNIYLGAALDEIETLYDKEGTTWQPSNFPEATNPPSNRVFIGSKKFKSAGKGYTMYMFGSPGGKNSGKEVVSEIYLVPDGYKRAFYMLPPRGEGKFDWNQAANTPPWVCKFVFHIIQGREDDSFVGAVVYERVYNEATDKESGKVYEIKLPDEIGNYILDIYDANANPKISSARIYSETIRDYSIMSERPAKNYANAVSQCNTYYKNLIPATITANPSASKSGTATKNTAQTAAKATNSTSPKSTESKRSSSSASVASPASANSSIPVLDNPVTGRMYGLKLPEKNISSSVDKMEVRFYVSTNSPKLKAGISLWDNSKNSFIQNKSRGDAYFDYRDLPVRNELHTLTIDRSNLPTASIQSPDKIAVYIYIFSGNGSKLDSMKVADYVWDGRELKPVK